MKERTHILPLILAICIVASSILCGFQEHKSASALEAGTKTVKFELPAAVVLNFAGSTSSPSAFLPFFSHSQIFYSFDLYKKGIRAKEHLLVNPYLRKAFYVFVSINAP